MGLLRSGCGEPRRGFSSFCALFSSSRRSIRSGAELAYGEWVRRELGDEMSF